MAMASEDAAMEARIARLESDVAHIRSDITEMKADIRSLRDRAETMYAKLCEKIDGEIHALDPKSDALKDALASAKTWALVLYIALAGSLYATLARGFGWI